MAEDTDKWEDLDSTLNLENNAFVESSIRM